MATIEQILAIDDADVRQVVVPEWGGITVRVACMSAADRAIIERDFSGKRASADPAGFRVAILSACLQGDDGCHLGPSDMIARLLNKSAVAIERLFDAACEVSGLAAGADKEVEKN